MSHYGSNEEGKGDINRSQNSDALWVFIGERRARDEGEGTFHPVSHSVIAPGAVT